MFIFVTYKDPAELSTLQRSISSDAEDTAVEKMLLVNPDCYVRNMLEFIRKRCRLAASTNFDLCEENGFMKNLFSYESYANVSSTQFVHKKNYYLVVLRQEAGNLSPIILPQLNRENKLYQELTNKITRFLLTGDVSTQVLTTDEKKKEKPAKKTK